MGLWITSFALALLAPPTSHACDECNKPIAPEKLDQLKAKAGKRDATAQYTLGWMYKEGAGVPQDFKTALNWLRQAAEQDYAPAQYHLGVMSGKGLGVTQDFAEAVNWIRKAADQGHAQAQVSLGLRYSKGQGVSKDLVEAYKWYGLAAARNYNSAETMRDRLAASMSREQVKEARRRVAEFRPRLTGKK